MCMPMPLVGDLRFMLLRSFHRRRRWKVLSAQRVHRTSVDNSDTSAPTQRHRTRLRFPKATVRNKTSKNPHQKNLGLLLVI